MLKAGMIIAERYEIAEKIGTGGMADVYRAMDHKLNRYVAVKVLKPEFRKDATFVKKFRSEAQAAAGLTHPNIVSIYDVGEDEGVYYIVMELIDGITLKEYISKKGMLSVKEATSIAIQVCMGLDAAHNHGIVHRDVKPQNIIISKDGKVKVTDFGIARAASSNTISSNVMGSVHYSSPEQVRGGYSDTKSDIYSLGITLYEMVTGKVPFDGENTVAIAIKHLQEEMVPPSVYAKDLPYSLEQIIFKCTQKSVNRRYEKMDEVIRDLKHSLIDPSGDFVTLNPVAVVNSKTKIISDRELGEIKSNSKTGIPRGQEEDWEQEDALYGEDRRIRKGRSGSLLGGLRNKTDVSETEEEEDASYRGKRNLARSQGSNRQIRKRNGRPKNASFVWPILGLLAGVALLIWVIIIVGRSAGLLGAAGNDTRLAADAVVKQEPDEVEEDTTVEVPDLVGKTEAEARALTSEAHIGLQNVGEEPSMYEKGLICRQEIEAGTRVESYTTIKYYISLGTAELTLPSVDGMTAIAAQEMLESMGLLVEKRMIYSALDEDGYALVDPGYAYYLEPESGSSGHVGDTVTLVVSRGADYGDSAEVPSVVGMQQNAALTVLGKFLNINVTREMSSTVPAGEVISQYPEGGILADPDNDMVTITISSGEDNPEQNEAADSVVQDETVAAAIAAGEVWKCTQRLNTPPGYHGGLLRLQLVQEAGGQQSVSTVVEGEVLEFPYQLNLEGVPGVSVGTVYLYEQIEGVYQELGIYTLEFKKVS